VASPPVLAFYLNRTLPPGVVPSSVLELAVGSLTDRTALQAVLDGLSAEDIEALLDRLASYEEDFPREAVEPACAVLLGSYSSLRKGSTGFLDPGPELAVGRVVSRLLRCLPESRRPPFGGGVALRDGPQPHWQDATTRGGRQAPKRQA